jgi:hypothetical protein
MISRMATAGEGPGGIIAGSCRVTSVFRTFINICTGQQSAEREERKEEHDFTVHNLCNCTVLIHMVQQMVNFRRSLGMSRKMLKPKDKLNRKNKTRSM